MKSTNFAIEVKEISVCGNIISVDSNIEGHSAYVYWRSTDPSYDQCFFIYEGVTFAIKYKDVNSGKEQTLITTLKYPLSGSIPVFSSYDLVDYKIIPGWGPWPITSADWTFGEDPRGCGFFYGCYEKNGILYADWAWSPGGSPWWESSYRATANGYKLIPMTFPLLRLSNARTLSIGKLPSKTSYKNDENIDYTGVEVIYG